MNVGTAGRRSASRALMAALMVTMALGGALAAAGCAAESTAGAPDFHYANADYGFTLNVPADFVVGHPKGSNARHSGLLFTVAFANPQGTIVSGKAVDVVEVAVYKLNRTASSSDVGTHEADFEGIAAKLIGRPEGLQVAAPFALTKLGGVPALTTTYVFRASGQDIATIAYLVPRGKRLYWVTAQAARENWDQSGQRLSSLTKSFAFD